MSVSEQGQPNEPNDLLGQASAAMRREGCSLPANAAWQQLSLSESPGSISSETSQAFDMHTSPATTALPDSIPPLH